MKKIFAFILASIMVLSLVPASVFAAISDVRCPEEHTIKTAPGYTEIAKVEPACGQDGYTIYKCKKCGVQFIDNRVAAPKHKWVSDADAKHVDVPASCIDGSKSIKWEKCSLCGATPKNCTQKGCNGKCGKGYNQYAPAHTLTYVSGAGCEAMYNCSVCKNNFYKDSKGNPVGDKMSAHSWQFSKAITEPNRATGTNGMALYECVNKNCDDTKEVVIFSKCQNHVWTLTTKYKAPTCTAVGNNAVYTCDVCQSVEYRDENGAVKEDKVIPMVEHTYVAGTEVQIPGQCAVTVFCVTCNTYTTVAKHITPVLVHYTPATCSTIGYRAFACTSCGENWIETIPAAEHQTVRYEARKANCVSGGVILYLCPDPNCATPVQYTQYVSYLINSPYPTYSISNVEITPANVTDGHAIAKQNVGNPSCTTVGIEITYCTNPGCTTYQYTQKQTGGKGHNTYIEWETYQYMDITNDGIDNPQYVRETVTRCTECDLYQVNQTPAYLPSSFNSKDEALMYHRLAVRKISYNKETKKFTTWYETMAQNGQNRTHEITNLSGQQQTANCIHSGYSYWTCTAAGCTSTFVIYEPVAKHVDADPIQGKVAATCSKEGNTGYYTCDVCGQLYVEIDGKQTVVTTRGIVTKKHSATLTEIPVLNCAGKKVSSYWKCSCGKMFADKNAVTEIGKAPEVSHDKITRIVDSVVATCNTAGIMGVNYCDTCKQIYVFKQVDAIDVELGKDAINTTWYSYNATKSALKAFQDLEGKWYLNYGASAPLALDIPKLEHVGTNNLVDDKHVIHDYDDGESCGITCPEYDHYLCALCGYEYIVDYTPAHDHVNKAGQALKDACDNQSVTDRKCVVCEKSITITKHTVAKLTKVTVTATCVSEGVTYYYCKSCGWTDTANTTISAVNKKHHAEPVNIITNYAQTGDKNVNKDVEDRTCTACGKKGTKATAIKDAGVEFMPRILVNGNESGAATYGSVITLIVDIGSIKGVNIWGFEFGVSYDPKVVEYVDYSFYGADLGFNTWLVNDVCTTTWVENGQAGADYALVAEKVPHGVVSVAAQADESHVNVKGTHELLALTFKVKYDATEAENGYYDWGFLFNIGSDVESQLEVVKYPVKVIGESGSTVKSMYKKNNSAEIEFVACGDLTTSDSKLTISDALELYTAITFKHYYVQADLNADGVLDLEDLRIFYALLTATETFNTLYGNAGNPMGDKEPRN